MNPPTMMEERNIPDGVYAASLTPQHDDLSIDTDALIAHLQWLLANGCTGVLLFGTTGEANSFSVAERLETLDAVLDAGIPASRLLVGTGCCALPDTVALTRHAVAQGAGGVLLLPPFYYKNVPEDGVFAAFDQVIQHVEEADLQIYLYHFPQMTAVPFTDDLVGRLLAAYPETIAGMKDSSGDWAHMKRTTEAFPGFRVFAGTERYLLDILEIGGAGCISASANVTCPVAGEVFARWRNEDMRPLQKRLTALRATIEVHPAIPTLKRLMAEQTRRSAWLNLRPPLASLHDEKAEALIDSLRQLNFFPEFV